MRGRWLPATVVQPACAIARSAWASVYNARVTLAKARGSSQEAMRLQKPSLVGWLTAALLIASHEAEVRRHAQP